MALVDNVIRSYRFQDDAASTVVIDGTATDNAILEGGDNTADITTTGILDKAFQFNGSDDRVYDTASISETGAWSVSMWIRFDSISALQYAFDTKASGRLIIGTDDSSNLAWYAASGWKTLDASPAINTWYHIVITESGSGTTGYLDGSSIDTGLSTELGATRTRIGSANAGTSAFFDGKICEVVIWDREITSAEVTSLYNSGTGFAYPFSSAGPDFTDQQVNIGDSWKAMADMQINIADVWKDVSEVWINVGDDWKQAV